MGQEGAQSWGPRPFIYWVSLCQKTWIIMWLLWYASSLWWIQAFQCPQDNLVGNKTSWLKMAIRSNAQFLAAYVTEFMTVSFNLSTIGGITTMGFNCTVGQLAAPHSQWFRLVDLTNLVGKKFERKVLFFGDRYTKNKMSS